MTEVRTALVDWRDYSSSTLHPILAASLTCFAQNGFHGTTTRSVASEAGLSVPGVYHHFPSKHAILVAVMRHAMDDLWRRSCAAFEEAGDSALLQFTLVVECMLEFHTRRRDEAFIAISEIRSLNEAARREHIAARDRQQRLVDEIVERGANDGVFDTPTPKDASRAVVTMCTAVSQWYRPDGGLSSSELARRYGSIALRAVGAPLKS